MFKPIGIPNVISNSSRAAVMTAVLALACIVVAPVAAFQLTPMSAVIEPDAESPTVVFTVNNTNDAPIAVQLRVATRSILPDGTEINNDASDTLQVFPSQLVLRPDTSQTVRVRWIGSSTPPEELPFRLIAEQLPVNLNRQDEEESGVQFMLKYRATVYVRPPETAPEIVVDAVETDETDETVTIQISNNGSRHRLFSTGRIVLQRGESEAELPLADIEPFVTVNVLPGETRRVTVPLTFFPFIPDTVAFQFDDR